MNNIQIKRVYDAYESDDGYRILVDRLWPRGIKKEDLKYDLWAKEIAPSTELRKEFNHQEERFDEFKTHYIKELEKNDEMKDLLQKIKSTLEKEPVTLLYAAKNTTANQAVVLKEWLDEKV